MGDGGGTGSFLLNQCHRAKALVGKGQCCGVRLRHWAKVVPHHEAAILARVSASGSARGTDSCEILHNQAWGNFHFHSKHSTKISPLCFLLQFFYGSTFGGGFMEIRKVGYCYLQRKPNGRFVHLLVWLFNDEHVRVTFGCHRRLMPQHVMDFLVEVGRNPSGPPVAATPVRITEPPAPEIKAAMDNSESDDSDYATSIASSSDAQEGGECGADTRSARCPRYILSAPPPIPRVEDVPCFFQQLDLDEGACANPLKAEMGNDYNTDGGQRSESAIECVIGKQFKLQLRIIAFEGM
ncbi:hypothetical protein PIB30_072320 [Stylosanthes scabra]|uniref:Uncharacterized protein n=1 Tax=Stylosanthes scabra TaxID=79078 RepID=A0ABU6RPB5_9FABA|nr:hypothetical protein [Stylosanthes scabra]